MKQVKPVVVGYKQIEFNGEVKQICGFISKENLKRTVDIDARFTNIKSRFRPIYSKG